MCLSSAADVALDGNPHEKLEKGNERGRRVEGEEEEDGERGKEIDRFYIDR